MVVIPAQIFQPIRIDSAYEQRTDCQEMLNTIQQNRDAAHRYVASAQTKNWTSHPGQMLAQMDMIRAQEHFSIAEFTSKQVCPDVNQLRQHDHHKQIQCDNLKELRGGFTGFGSIVKNHGLHGLSVYYQSMFFKP